MRLALFAVIGEILWELKVLVDTCPRYFWEGSWRRAVRQLCVCRKVFGEAKVGCRNPRVVRD